MKIVRRSNYGYEDSRGDQYFVEVEQCTAAAGETHALSKLEAEAIANCLNELSGSHSDDFFAVVEDDYVLPKEGEP